MNNNRFMIITLSYPICFKSSHITQKYDKFLPVYCLFSKDIYLNFFTSPVFIYGVSFTIAHEHLFEVGRADIFVIINFLKIAHFYLMNLSRLDVNFGISKIYQSCEIILHQSTRGLLTVD